jgi:hypothetical protein
VKIKLKKTGDTDMSTDPTKSAPHVNAEHHNKAAECCDKAAQEHRHAAKSCTSGDHKKVAEHSKQADDHRAKAQDHSKQAIAA